MLMGKHHAPAVIEIFSPFWWQNTIVLILAIVFIVRLPLHVKKLKHRYYDMGIALLLLFNFLFENIYNYKLGYWNLQQNLPVHLCSISGFMCMSVLFNYKQWLAECVYYWGLAGGIQSILTPEFTIGMEGFNLYSYYIAHGGLILVVAYLIVHYQFKPRPQSWLKLFGYTQLVALGVGLVNYLVGANYMFLCAKPEVNNPFVIGDWPYYILVLEIVALVHFWILYLPFAKANKN
jgi:hypothetical integral membrane protein (TIGR02206 family)